MKGLEFARFVSVSILCVFLTACGGGGGSGGGVTIPPQPDYFSSYTGEKSALGINSDNFEEVVRLFLNEYANGQQTPDLTNSDTSSNGVSARRISEQGVCDNGNTYAITGEADEATKTGALSTRFVECGAGDFILNGEFSLYLTQYNEYYDDFDRKELRYTDLEFRKKADATDKRTVDATIVLTQDFKNLYESSTVNGLVSRDGKQFFYDNYKVVKRELYLLTLTGAVYLSDYGRFTISTPEGQLEENTYKPFPAGVIVLSSGSSKIRFNISHGEDNVKAELDVDGDGSCDESLVFDFKDDKNTFTPASCSPVLTPPPPIQ